MIDEKEFNVQDARHFLDAADMITDRVAKAALSDDKHGNTLVVAAAAMLAPGIAIMEGMSEKERRMTEFLINYLCDTRGHGQPCQNNTKESIMNEIRESLDAQG